MVVMRKMKEKCKDAARMRREKERVEFVELSKLLPLPSSTTSQLDKASIIRLTSSYLRMRSAFPQGLGESWGTKQKFVASVESVKSGDVLYPELSPNQASTLTADCGDNSSQLLNQIKELGSLLLQTLDGFVFALHRDGKIMYISETASVHLGLPQIDLTGSSVFDYIHPADHNDIMDIFNISENERAKLAQQSGSSHDQNQTRQNEETIELDRSFCMRMKCVLPKRNAGLVSNGYKAIHCSGYLKAKRRGSSSTYSKPSKLVSGDLNLADQKVWDSYALVAVGHSLLSTASTEIKLDSKTFMFRTNLDLRLHFIETLATNLLGYQQSEMIGESLYQFVHAADLHDLELAHKQVLEKGQVVSKYYRLVRQGGGYVWVQTYATIINNPRSMPKPQHIVGICRVIGESQHDDSRLILIAEPIIGTESSSFTAKKAIEPASVLINTSHPQSWVNAQPSLGAKPTERLINRFNRNQKRANLKQHPSSRTSKLHNFKKLSTSKTGLDMREGKLASNSLTTIGSMRRKSDDSCSVVSSVASSTSSQTPSCRTYISSNQTIHSPSYHTIISDQSYPYRVGRTYLLDEDQGVLIDPASVSNHTSQYPHVLGCDHTNKCGLQGYWSRYGMQAEKATIPISIDTSIDHNSSVWTTAIPMTVSPTLTTSTTATGQVSADGSPVGACSLSPERAYVSEQYYHKLHGQGVPCDNYQNDFNVTYSNGSQVYMDYTRSEGSFVSMTYDDQCTQSFYYTSHPETSYLTGNSFA